jgi:DNA-binding PadR family transcriptional regulator
VSSIDIILLGMLTEEPHNAYEVNKILEQRRTRTWLKISSAAVYRNLRRLHDEGYLEAHTTRDGLKPHKTVFTLSDTGRDHFVGLLEESAQSPVSLHFDFDAWVAHIHYLPPTRAVELLEGLASQLRKIRGELDAVSQYRGDALPIGAAALVELRLRVLELTLDWLNDFAIGHETSGGKSVLQWEPTVGRVAAATAGS